MELLEFLKSMSSSELDAFAVEVGTTVPHLRNVAYGSRVASAALAAQIQVKSHGKVQVSTLRPKDWHLVWGSGVNQTMKAAAIVADAAVDGLSPRAGLAESAGSGAEGGAHVGNVAARQAICTAQQTDEEKV